MACDEWVVARTGSPRAYARCLAHAAEVRAQMRGGPTLVPALIGSRHDLLLRVDRVLAINGRARRSVSLAGATTAACAMVMMSAQLQATRGFSEIVEIVFPIDQVQRVQWVQWVQEVQGVREVQEVQDVKGVQGCADRFRCKRHRRHWSTSAAPRSHLTQPSHLSHPPSRRTLRSLWRTSLRHLICPHARLRACIHRRSRRSRRRQSTQSMAGTRDTRCRHRIIRKKIQYWRCQCFQPRRSVAGAEVLMRLRSLLATALVVTSGLIGAGSTKLRQASHPDPWARLPVVREHTYRMAGKIRLLMLWVGRDDVGSGVIRWRGARDQSD